MHEITLLQGLSLAALVFVLGIDFWLEALFLFRPIIVCTLTGAILGDIQTCLLYTSPSPRDGLLSRMPSSA